MAKRIEYIDVAKGIGMILIVFGHALKEGPIYQVIYSFHIPLFFFLSGMTYRRKNAMEFWKNKFVRLYVPYIVFSIISIGLFSIAGKLVADRLGISLMDGSILDNVFGMLYGNSRTGFMKWNVPLWFIPCLLSVYALANLTESFVNNIRGGKRYHMLLVSLICGYLFSTAFLKLKLPFAFEAAFYLLFYFELGVMVRKWRQDGSLELHQRPFYVRIIAVFLCIAFVIGISLINGFAQVRTLQFGKSYLLYLITAVLGIAATLILSSMLEKSKVLAYIGVNSLPVLLLHKFPLLFFQSLFSPTKKLLSNSNSVSSILCAALISAVALVGCLLFGKLIEKICPMMVGASKKKEITI